MKQALLFVDQTSPTCVRYVLAAGGKRIWSCRVAPDDAGHMLARERMAAWARRHGYVVHDGEGKVIVAAPAEALVRRV